MTTIIGIVGGKGVGKTTLANALIRALDYDALVIKMADPLKTMLRSVGLTDDEIEGYLKEQPCPLLCNKSPRHAMQTLGTEWGRHCIGQDFWTKLWERQVALCAKSVVITDDVRFNNEAEAVLNSGGHLVYLGGVDANDLHPSETEMHGIPHLYPTLNIAGQFPRSMDVMPNIVEYILRNTVNRRTEPTYDPNDTEIPF